MSGTTVNFGTWSSPAGGTAIVNASSGAIAYLHKDWLGSARLVSNTGTNAEIFETAYAPYGELYDSFGTNSSQYEVFAGQTSNFAKGLLGDTPNREYSPSNQGRWISPDPVGAGWNAYAYPANPNSLIDPSGLSGDCPLTTRSCVPQNLGRGISGTGGLSGMEAQMFDYGLTSVGDDPFNEP